MTFHEELIKETKMLGYDDPDEAIRDNWENIPKWIQEELLKSGFTLNTNK